MQSRIAHNCFLINENIFCSLSDEKSQPWNVGLVAVVSFRVFKVVFDDNSHQRMRLVYKTAGATSNFARLLTWLLAILEEVGSPQPLVGGSESCN